MSTERKQISKPYTEEAWLRIVTQEIEESDSGYVATWWVRLTTGIPTATINYHLTKLSNKGLLKKETNKHCTKFSLPQ